MKALTTLRRFDCYLYNLAGRPFDAYRLQQRAQQPRRPLRTALLALLLLLLASCAASRQNTMPARSERHKVEHDPRVRTAEPEPSHIR